MDLAPTLEQRAECSYVFFEWVLNNMMVPGKIETWFLIMDFEGISLGEVPIKELKGFVGNMQRNFRGRMSKNIMINTHWLV